MKERFNNFRQFIAERKIIIALGIATVVAVIAASVSVWAYNVSDVSRLDISRPGYEEARDSVIKGDESISFGATGTLDADAMKDFQSLYDDKHQKLDAIGSFDGNLLSDDLLKTTTSE